jgi:hypothetical protein
MSDKNPIHTLQLDELYVEALVEILVFAAQTAAYLASKEAVSGRAGKDLIKLARIANDSKDLIQLLKESIGIGEPDSSEFLN